MSEVMEEKPRKERKSKKDKKSEGNKTKKTKKVVKSDINEVNNDNLYSSPPDTKLNYNILKIEFEPFQVNNRQYSKIITKAFGNETETLNSATIEFFYNEKLDIEEINKEINILRSNVFDVRQKFVNSQILNYKKKLRDALNIPKVLKGIRTCITYLDGVSDEDTIKTLPRYQRLKRLESLYETVIKIGLTLIHNYYWNDITKNETSVDFSIKEAIARASPTIIQLKHDMEEVVRIEFSYSVEDEKVIMSNRAY
jgi:predicted DNA-binding protein YlxM (UPF0122 family)/flavin-binding protein dodecin